MYARAHTKIFVYARAHTGCATAIVIYFVASIVLLIVRYNFVRSLSMATI